MATQEEIGPGGRRPKRLDKMKAEPRERAILTKAGVSSLTSSTLGPVLSPSMPKVPSMLGSCTEGLPGTAVGALASCLIID